MTNNETNLQYEENLLSAYVKEVIRGMHHSDVTDATASQIVEEYMTWKRALLDGYAKAALLDLADSLEGSVAWTENNFLPGPNSDKYISEHKFAIAELRERAEEYKTTEGNHEE